MTHVYTLFMFHQEEALEALEKVCGLLPPTIGHEVSSLYTCSSVYVQLVYTYCRGTSGLVNYM